MPASAQAGLMDDTSEWRAAPDAFSAPGAGAPGAEEAALIARVARGDERAFDAMVGRYHRVLYRVAWRLLDDPAEAEDVVQEVFVKLWRDPERLAEVASLKPWLCRVTANAAIDRRRKRRPDTVTELPETPDGSAGPEESLRRSEATGAVEAMLARLPERQQLALVLTYYEGFSNIEAGAAMGISVEAVESLLARARRTLRERLAGRWQALLEDMS